MPQLKPILCCALFAMAVASPALAQPSEARAPTGAQPEWVIVPTTDDEKTQWMAPSIDAVRRELHARGQTAWSPEAAADRYEVVGSAPAPALSSSDIDLWVARSRAALRYLARADYRAARRELQGAQGIADRAAAELNREAARARQVLDTCLYMVRALIETDEQAAARAQARECRLLVPRVEPSAYRHTPEVVELLERVDRELAREAPGQLTVFSEPSKCAVRVNGIEFGHTPLRDLELPVGAYRLQVECREKRSRIRRVSITAGVNEVFFDTRFEKSLQSRPVVHLRYRSADDEDLYRIADADYIARTLSSKHFLLLRRIDEHTLRVDLIEADQEPSSIWVKLEHDAPRTSDLVVAFDALLSGKSKDFTESPAARRSAWTPPRGAAQQAPDIDDVPRPKEREPRARELTPKTHRIAGYTLLGAGGAAYFAGLGLHFRRNTLGDDFIANPSSRIAAQDWKDSRLSVWLPASLGAAAMTSAVPLVLPYEEGTPWWGWLSGGLGVGFAAYAIYQAATLTSCDESVFVGNAAEAQRCVDRGKESDRAILTGAIAVPLLTMPLVYWLRPEREIRTSFVVHRGLVMVHVGGKF